MSFIAIDSMIVDYLVQAMDQGYDPSEDTNDHLRPERIATFRLFLWSELYVPPTVAAQLSATRDQPWRERLQRLVAIHLVELAATLDASLISQRVSDLRVIHRDPEDCRVVAESEIAGACVLLSFDHRLRSRLASRTSLQLLKPSDCWERLGVIRGTAPRWIPATSNPIGSKTWWHW